MKEWMQKRKLHCTICFRKERNFLPRLKLGSQTHRTQRNYVKVHIIKRNCSIIKLNYNGSRQDQICFRKGKLFTPSKIRFTNAKRVKIYLVLGVELFFQRA